MYQRQLQVYKGIDNVLQFRLLNADQKPIDVSAFTPKFVAFDETRSMIIERNCTLVPGDDSAAQRGLFSVVITENDLLNVKDQFLHYNIYLVDTNGTKSLTYADAHFSNNSVIKVSSDAFPAPSLSKELVFLQSQENDSYWVTSAEYAQPGVNGNEALHTAVIYSNGYIGTVTIQATLDNQIEVGTDWADIETVTFVGNETQPVAVNFNGVFNYIRLTASADPATKITKVLVRN